MKLNQNATIGRRVMNEPTRTTNYEGGIAFTMDPKSRLYSRVASAMIGEKKFYTSAAEADGAILDDIQAVAAEDPKFVLQLAAFARNRLYLRTVSVVLLVEAALNKSTQKYVRGYTPSIIRRADELAEATAYLQKRIGDIGNHSKTGSMPSALKRGLADTFHNFDEYQFAKYNRDNVVKLKDVVRLVHPKPKTKKESALFKRILTDRLATPDTWEVMISEGSTTENWEKAAEVMPYMALLRNLRNLLEKNVSPAVVKSVADKLMDPKNVKHNKQFPFRYYSAYREIQNTASPYTSKLMDALEFAMDASVDNIPHLKGVTFAAADNSGSMSDRISGKSTIERKNIANLFLTITNRICDESITSIFGESFKVINFSQRNGVISNMASIDGESVGESTNAYLTADYLAEKKIKVDRFVLFSDLQCYDDQSTSPAISQAFIKSFRNYKAKINPKVYLYSIDLGGYGTLQVPQNEPRSAMIAGWSDKILSYIPVFEEDKKSAVEAIQREEELRHPEASAGDDEE